MLDGPEAGTSPGYGTFSVSLNDNGVVGGNALLSPRQSLRNLDITIVAAPWRRDSNHFMCLRDCSFSTQSSSINSVSTTMRCFNVTVQGLV